MEKIIELFKKYKEQILYLFFGGVTTLVSMGTIILFDYGFGIIGIKARIPSDIIAMTVAYITNKIWVFESKCKNFKELFNEIVSFYGARVFTLVLSVIIVYIFVDRMHMNNVIVNVITSVVVTILNYVFSKLFIFKKGK